MESDTSHSGSKSLTQVAFIPHETKCSFEVDSIYCTVSATRMPMYEGQPQLSFAGAFGTSPPQVLRERGLALTVYQFNVSVLCGGGWRILLTV